MRPLKILLLCDNSSKHANTTLEHINSFRKYSKHLVTVFNPVRCFDFLLPNLNSFDVVVIHYSICILFDTYMSKKLAAKISKFKGLKVQFIQDDYRWVDAFVQLQSELGINILYTLCPEREIPKVWGPLISKGVKVIQTLAGYVPEKWTQLTPQPIACRQLDVFYRGRELPYWLGELSQDKIRIARGFKSNPQTFELKTDIEWTERKRLYGRAWVDQTMSTKTVLGTESGASITDFDGSIEANVNQFIENNPQADFADVSREVLAPHEGNVLMNVISPRVFEAAAFKTALVLFPGEYCGVIEAERNYISLQKDFSNIQDVVTLIKDNKYLQNLVDRTYADLVLSGKYSYKSFIQKVDQVLEDECLSKNIVRPQLFKVMPFYTRTFNRAENLRMRYINFEGRVLMRLLTSGINVLLSVAGKLRNLIKNLKVGAFILTTFFASRKNMLTAIRVMSCSNIKDPMIRLRCLAQIFRLMKMDDVSVKDNNGDTVKFAINVRHESHKAIFSITPSAKVSFPEYRASLLQGIRNRTVNQFILETPDRLMGDKKTWLYRGGRQEYLETISQAAPALMASIVEKL